MAVQCPQNSIINSNSFRYLSLKNIGPVSCLGDVDEVGDSY